MRAGRSIHSAPAQLRPRPCGGGFLRPVGSPPFLLAARDAGVFVMEAMWNRFLPQFYTLRALLARGVIGDIVHVYAMHGQAISHVPRIAQSQLAGGGLLDLGVYPVSFVHHLLGAPTNVRSAGHLNPAGVDETVAITMTYPRALGVVASTTRAQHRRDHRHSRADHSRGGVLPPRRLPYGAPARRRRIYPHLESTRRLSVRGRRGGAQRAREGAGVTADAVAGDVGGNAHSR